MTSTDHTTRDLLVNHRGDRAAVEVGGRRVAFHHALIATGGSPAVPPVPGLVWAEPLTSDTVWGT